MKAIVRLFVALVVVAGLASPSSAGLVAGVIPGGSATNDFIGTLPGTTIGDPVGGWYGAQVYLTGTSDLLVEWFGGEAGFQNEFSWETDLLFKHNVTVNPSNPSASDIADEILNDVAGGLLPFSFFVPTGSLTVANGTNPDNSGTAPNFFVTFDLTQTTGGGTASGKSVWLFFDDGGAANDDNHDDMAIRISITDGGEFTVVPEPGSMLLLGSGLGALWMRRRRR